MIRLNALLCWVAALAAVFAVAGTSATAVGQSVSAKDLRARYETLKANSGKAKIATKEAKVGNSKIRLVGPTEIAPAPPIENSQPLTIGVKLWGQVLNAQGKPGEFVNLTKHKWQRKEKFWLWIETAVPLQLAVFQNYPDGRPPSRQVSPDDVFPDTFGTILPGEPYRFPVQFQMDDDLRDEIVSFVVVRAAAAVLPINGATISATATATATATVIIDGKDHGEKPNLAGVVGQDDKLDPVLAQKSKAILSEINTAARSKPAVKSAIKLNLVSVAEGSTSQNAADVEVLMMGAGNVAQIELTFHKD